jgi:hypothetical protein
MRVAHAGVPYCLPIALAMPALVLARNRGALVALVLAWVPVVAVTGPHSPNYWRLLVVARAVLVMAARGLHLAAALRSRLGALVQTGSLLPTRTT